MKQGLSIRVCDLILILALGILVGCDDVDKGTAPGTHTSLTNVVSLTPNLDAGAPVTLDIDGDRMAILYSCLFKGTGDIYRLEVTDADGDEFFESIETELYYPNDNDLSINYEIPRHDQFTQIGAYEVESSGDIYPVYPGSVYFSGPRQLFYDWESDRVFYSMGYGGVAQIASTQSPMDAGGGHFGEIVNEYDAVLRDYSSGVGRPPIYDYWYTVTEHGGSTRFSGGYCASVSPEVEGARWLSYADTLNISFDHDGDGERGEDPPGFIEVVEGGATASDGAPGYLDEDDDGDGGADMEDLEVMAMLVENPDNTLYDFDVPATQTDENAFQYYAWMLQNYDPAQDDDEDGLMNEDLPNYIDNDGDGLVNEDPAEDPIDDDGDGSNNEDAEEPQIDNDNDGLFSEDPAEEQIDNDGDGLFDEDPVDGLDNDDDGLFDEDDTEQIDNDGDGLVNEDPEEPQIDNDGDGLFSEDPPEDPIDDDGDGRFNEDGPDAFDDDGDGRIDEDAYTEVSPGVFDGDMNGDGLPGNGNYDDDGDGLADSLDLEVKHALLRSTEAANYDPLTDDDEDGISDEDADTYRNGLWVVKVNADGTPDHDSVPICLTNNGERQPFFNPVDGSDLLYVKDGDIHKLPLTLSADNVEVAGDATNLTNSESLEAYPSYSDEGDRIAYCSSFYGSSDIWVMNPDGGGQVQITNEPGQELYPRFIPGGRQILYEGWLFPAGVRNVMITVQELP